MKMKYLLWLIIPFCFGSFTIKAQEQNFTDTTKQDKGFGGP